jgi:ubiquinone/menaquinone biosynthesis C-methylase UbiE
MSQDLAQNIERFSGFADVYDKYRPQPPDVLAEILCSLAEVEQPALVVDLGCGTGLSTRYWGARAQQVIGVDPSPDMLKQAEAATSAANVHYRQGTSHATGLAGRCADIVTCSQALHWMEPLETFREAQRILRPGGVFAAYDYDWPPMTTSWEACLAYEVCQQKVRRLEKAQPGGRPQQLDKAGHLERMRASGCFRYVKEIALHQKDSGNAERFVGLLLSQGSVSGLLKRGLSEAEIGLDEVREVAQRKLGDAPSPWLWSSRLRLGVV